MVSLFLFVLCVFIIFNFSVIGSLRDGEFFFTDLVVEKQSRKKDLLATSMQVIFFLLLLLFICPFILADGFHSKSKSCT